MSVFSIISSSYKNLDTTEYPVGIGYSVGSTGPGGGTIFYDAGTIQTWGRWLEVAQNGWHGTYDDPRAVWGNMGTNVGNRAEIGTGLINTQEMIANGSWGDTINAAPLATSYRGGRKSDWFIPSKDELLALNTWVHNNNIPGFVTSDYPEYASSTSISFPHFYAYDIMHNFSNNELKFTATHIRPIRYVKPTYSNNLVLATAQTYPPVWVSGIEWLWGENIPQLSAAYADNPNRKYYITGVTGPNASFNGTWFKLSYSGNNGIYYLSINPLGTFQTKYTEKFNVAAPGQGFYMDFNILSEFPGITFSWD